MNDLRAFIAIKPSKEIITRLGAIETRLNTGKIKGAWVKPENAHLTLRFLGSINETRLDEIEAAMKLSVSRPLIRPFTLIVSGIGAFPSLKAPRIIWIGIDNNDTLNRLYNGLEQELSGVGFEKEGRAFHPHLTICRVRSTSGAYDLTSAVAVFQKDEPIVFPVSSIGLYKSVSTPKGPLYTLVKEARLR
ncbi:MAG: RNA 2',3'-cyclic phosphodiesterase [Deltaproteobacteria bacterium]|nr:RNA 2',3'-cyclic phosphodiesterase [Deltaproteobacteria bacterium]